MKCNYLDGENITPSTTKQARDLIGVNVTYLTKGDIDRSGRGYFFPREGVVAGVHGRNIAFDEPGNFLYILSDIVEMVKKKGVAKKEFNGGKR